MRDAYAALLDPARAPVAWVMNLDAEDELRAAGASTPSAAMRARIDALVERLRGSLLRADDLVLSAPSAATSARGLTGLAWCPTPSALRRLSAAGATPPAALPREVLRQVNGRAFCAALGQTLPGAVYATTQQELARAIEGPSPSSRWVMKRPFGFTGRGRLLVPQGALDADARRWAEASLRDGDGMQIEPWVERVGDFAVHGLLSSDGSIRTGTPTRLICSEQGAWIRSELADADALTLGEHEMLIREAERTGQALYRAGYIGPFNLDAFRYRDSEGRLAFNPRCEINARLSMGWALGMGCSVA